MNTTEELDDEETVEELTSEQKRQVRVGTYLNDLGSMVGFLAAHLDLIPDSGGLNLTVTAFTAEELATRLRQLGTCEKIDSEWYSGGKVKFGDHTVAVQTYKENTCSKVPTGEIKVNTVQADPSSTLPKGARNVRTVTKVAYDIDEEVTTWDCGQSLLNPPSEDVDA